MIDVERELDEILSPLDGIILDAYQAGASGRTYAALQISKDDLRLKLLALLQPTHPVAKLENVSSSVPADGELSKQIDSLLYKFADYIRHYADTGLGGPDNQTATNEAIMQFFAAHLQAAVREAFEHGRAVGQYQAADKMYGDVTQIYMFGDNPTATKAKSIAGWSANGLLEDCERFMNDNSPAYNEYLKQLTPKEQE